MFMDGLVIDKRRARHFPGKAGFLSRGGRPTEIGQAVAQAKILQLFLPESAII
jgi:hypothetical protein